MTCIRTSLGIVTLSDECEPFFFRGKRFSVSKRWGPFACDRHGDPLKNQPSGRMLQAAYKHYMSVRT